MNARLASDLKQVKFRFLNPSFNPEHEEDGMLTRIGRPSHGKPWDEASDMELRARVEAGEMLPAIAKAMGRTQEAVRSRANIMHIPVKSSPGRGRRAMTALPVVSEGEGV